ncbi:MAG: hypothetical protein JJT96_14110 [Opitutales bacterium]|nr:hypothetical protein [Opitutales bacterium]
MNVAAAILPLLLLASSAFSEINRLDRWFLVEDPPNANFSASRTGSGAGTTVTLTATNAAIPSGTDIGYQSFNGNTAEESSAGYTFDPGSDFTVAIDYSITYGGTNPLNLGIGFGIGEDGNGANSAGVALARTEVNVFGNLLPAIGIGGAARIDDVNQPIATLTGILNGLSDNGSFFITYTAATGTITVGRSATPGAGAPENAATFTGIQNSWQGRDLIVSFFMRSEGWTGGTATATFDNLRVLNGTPKGIPPRVTSVARTGGMLDFSFKGGTGWDYFIQGGTDLVTFPDDLTGEPGTVLSESPAGSGIFRGSVDISGKGDAYFLRFTDQPPTGSGE